MDASLLKKANHWWLPCSAMSFKLSLKTQSHKIDLMHNVYAHSLDAVILFSLQYYCLIAYIMYNHI